MFFTYVARVYVPNVLSVLVAASVFMLQVASVLSRYCICCSGYTRMMQVYVPNVLAVSGCCIYCSGYTHMLQAYVSNISPVSDVFCSKYFVL
jgi:hypothetical protein